MGSDNGVLLMAYGTPRDLDEVEEYYTDIRRGRPPPPDLLEELKERYRAIGGRSPLLEITEAQARGLEERLDGTRVFVGLKHSRPFIGDAVRALAEAGIRNAVGLVLAPHFSSMSVGDYERRARAAAEDIGWEGRLLMIDSWHLAPGYIDLLADRVNESVGKMPEPARRHHVVLFTAHSLPKKVLEQGDPYPRQLEETAGAVARRAGVISYRTAWQSAGRTTEPWIGPDVLEVIAQEHDEGTKGIVVCPCGFVADHLEVLYDLDIEARAFAQERGMSFERTRSPNADVEFLDTLAAVVQRARAGGP